MLTNQKIMANRISIPNAPTQIVWIAAQIIGFSGILGHYTSIDVLSKYNYEMLLIAFALLFIGTTFRKV